MKRKTKVNFIKSIKSYIMIGISLIIVISLGGCTNDSNPFESYSYTKEVEFADSSIFVDNYSNIINSKSLGIVKEPKLLVNKTTNHVNLLSNRVIDVDILNVNNYQYSLFSINLDGDYEKVTFIIDNMTVNQDDIDFQFYKLYTTYDYTFFSVIPKEITPGVQFVVSETITVIGIDENGNNIEEVTYEYGYVPPRDDSILDKFGVSIFDKTNYVDNEYVSNFVINNATGKIYSLKDFPIEEVNSGLVKNGNFIYDFTIVDDNLTFIPIFTNETIEIYDFFQDKYGQNFIFNSNLDEFDDSTNTLYFIDFDPHDNESRLLYFLSNTGEAIRVHKEKFVEGGIIEVKLIGDDWKIEDIDTDKEYMLNSDPIRFVVYYNIYKGVLYFNFNTVNLYAYDIVEKMHISFDVQSEFGTFNVIDYHKDYSTVFIHGGDLYFWDYRNWYHTLIYSDKWNSVIQTNPSYDNYYRFSLDFDSDNIDFTYSNFERHAFLNYYDGYPAPFIEIEDLLEFDIMSLLIENVEIGEKESSYIDYGVSGNVTYYVIHELTVDGYVIKIFTDEYVAPEVEIITLQPIN